MTEEEQLNVPSTHLILGVQHDFHTFVRGGDVRSELHTSCGNRKKKNWNKLKKMVGGCSFHLSQLLE